MLSVVVADLRTGRRIIPVPYSAVTLEKRRNTAEGMRVTLTLKDSAHRALNLYSNAQPGKAMLGVCEGDFVAGLGPIWSHDYDDDSKRLTIESEGWWSYFYRRFILPNAAETMPLLLQTGENAGEPNPATRTAIVQKSWPAMVRILIEQAMSREGGQLPLVFGPDGVGAHDKTYEGSAFKTLGAAFDDLVDLDNGPEIEFAGRFTADRKGLEVLVRVGDDAQREIASTTVHRFDFSVTKPSVRKLRIKRTAAGLTSEAWATGGRQAAVALIARAASPFLTNAGFVRFESMSSAHSTVTEQPTLDSYAREDLARGQRLTDFWSFETKMDAPPKFGNYSLGDYADVIVSKNNAYGIPAGRHRRRIAAFSLDERKRWVSITTDEAVE